MKSKFTTLICLLALFSLTMCGDKEDDEAETKLATTASLLKGTWKWSRVQEETFNKEGRPVSSTDEPVNETWMFDGANLTDYSMGTPRPIPYNITLEDNKAFITISDSGNKSEITEINSVKMYWSREVTLSDGGKIFKRNEFTRIK